MSVPFVRGILDDILRAEGLKLAPFGRDYKLWQREPHAEVSPFFSPSVVRSGNGAAIHGVIGVCVNEFEQDWTVRLRKHYPRKAVGDGPLFGRYITNFELLIDPPTISQHREDALMVATGWIRTILGYTEEFPHNITDLISGLARGSVGSYPAWWFLGHWVKWMAFLVWLEEHSYEFPSSLYVLKKNKTVDPYEAVFDDLSNAIPVSRLDGEPVDATEMERLVEIVKAIGAGDWERFKFLSDEPFINEESMREQFDDSHLKVDMQRTDLHRDARVGVGDDGTRLITALLKNKNRKGKEIVLTVHTYGERQPRKFGIWAFFELLTWE